MLDGVKTLDSAIRTLLLATLVGLVGYGIYFAYAEYTKRERLIATQESKIKETEAKLVALNGDLQESQAQVATLEKDVAEKKIEIERLSTAMNLLKVDQRLAQLRVIDIERGEDGRATTSRLEFVELSPDGDPLSPPKQFELPGDLVYVDNWVVKFDDEFIEQADLQRGTSLCLFRRIFSEQQLPTEGISLDEVGMRPQAYASGGAMSEFEKSLWSDFWEFANDPQKAAKIGIRAANGEAVSIKVREGKVYNISLRASGGLSIEPANPTALNPQSN